MDKHPLFRKGLVVGIILLFIELTGTQNINANNPISNHITSVTCKSNIALNNGTLSGHVTDSEENPIEGARVRVYFHDTYSENYSDSTGYFHVTNISICNCTKNATCLKEGYYPVWVYLGIWENTTYDFVLSSKGDWLYVGGDGPGNYTRIQDAIDNASDGDTVFVYSGMYNERLWILNVISLFGESRNTTIITCPSSNGSLIYLYADGITITGFTLVSKTNSYRYIDRIISNQNDHIEKITISKNILYTTSTDSINLRDCSYSTISDNIFYLNVSVGIYMQISSNCTITNNLFNGNPDGAHGIYFYRCRDTLISNNSFNSNEGGLAVTWSESNTISKNYFFNNQNAISLDSSWYNDIIANRIENIRGTWGYFHIGIELTDDSSRNIIEKNFISHCRFGVFLSRAWDTMISMNTFMNNIVHARFFSDNILPSNHWDQNYWGRPRVLPKPIFGVKSIYNIYPGFFEFDWHPAQEPYDAPGMS